MRGMLRVVRVGPATWPAIHADANGRYTTARQQRKEAAGCRAGAVLVLWPPTCRTHWPSGGGAAPALKAAENEEEAEEGGE